MTAAVDHTADNFGRLDILVNNAGIYVPRRSTTRRLPTWIGCGPSTCGRILASQAALKHMPDGGRIINIGSCLAERVSGPGVTLYAMSKAALVGLTKGLARPGPRGITVNNIEPGPIDTDMNPASGEGADNQAA